MIDILFVTKGRAEFTAASREALIANTDWAMANLRRLDNWPSPVSAMNSFMRQSRAEIFAKIDNDVIVPPGWLDRCLAVMDANPELDLLGIEPPSSTIRVSLAGAQNGYSPCDSIGGIGLMRRRAFEGRAPIMPTGTYGGFTDWQLAHPDVRKGWLAPSIPLFLLDRLPMEPWAGLSRRYIAEGLQRPWKNYSPEDAHLWEWWLKDKSVAA